MYENECVLVGLLCSFSEPSPALSAPHIGHVRHLKPYAVFLFRNCRYASILPVYPLMYATFYLIFSFLNGDFVCGTFAQKIYRIYKSIRLCLVPDSVQTYCRWVFLYGGSKCCDVVRMIATLKFKCNEFLSPFHFDGLVQRFDSFSLHRLFLNIFCWLFSQLA